MSLIFQIFLITVLISVFYLQYHYNSNISFSTISYTDQCAKKIKFEYDLDISEEDAVTYYKYEIWRFYEKRRIIFAI